MKLVHLRGVPSCVTLSADEKTAYVCAWCQSKAEGDRWARDHGIEVSHGMCSSCYELNLIGDNL